MTERRTVIQIQGAKLCELLELPPGTKIPKNVIELVAKSEIYSEITVGGKTVVVKPSAIALATLLIGKQVIR